jgi:uncharacterized protein (DUF302 family)
MRQTRQLPHLYQEIAMNEKTSTHRMETTFTGKRIRYNSMLSYDTVLDGLRASIGTMSLQELTDTSGGRNAFETRINQAVGSSGFVLVADLDHGAWIAEFGVQRRARRWIFGNPLVAITLIRHDIDAGLFVPPELLVVENADGQGCYVLYVQPSSLVVVKDHPALLDATRALDVKVDAFVRAATQG